MPATSESTREKKRKRLTIDIESFNEVGDKIAPFIGYFPSGFDPVHASYFTKEDAVENVKVRVFRNKKFCNRLQLVVSPQGSKIEFVGTSYSGEAAAPHVCTYSLGILDKESNALKIVPIEGNKVFRLEPKLRCSPNERGDEGAEVEIASIKRSDLSKRYGTNKSKLWVKRMDAWRSVRDPVTEKELESKLQVISVNEAVVSDAVEYHELNIPPHDPTATVPEAAYLLDRIILKGEWDCILDIFELSQSRQDAGSSTIFWESKGYPSFVCNRIYKLKEIDDEDERKKLACIFSYITSLIKFKKLPNKFRKLISVDRYDTLKFQDIPVILFHKFGRMFVDPEANTIASEKMDLLISYILVLTLFVDGFKSDPSDIARDLKMISMDLCRHYEKLGCRLSKVNKSLLVTLQVPLKFPTLKAPRRRGRR